MMITVALPQGWGEFARQIDKTDLTNAMVQAVNGWRGLPADPGEGPDRFSFYMPEQLGDHFGLNGEIPDEVLRRSVALFVNAAQEQARREQEATLRNRSWTPPGAAWFLKAALVVLVVGGILLCAYLANRVRGRVPVEGEPSVDDYSSWEPES